jgi:uncharacterized pyridoxamine 5'-phosphate oxidase family protein
MNKFDEAMKNLDEKFGGKDLMISLATIALAPSDNGKSQPRVRIVDAYYEDGAFYTVTNSESTKMKELAQSAEAAICVINFDSVENFTASGIGENIGWVLDEKNAEIIPKVREAFAAWYYQVNNEKDEHCCLLRFKMTKGLWCDPHKGLRTEIDFVDKTVSSNSGV